jgi:transposase-like protein
MPRSLSGWRNGADNVDPATVYRWVQWFTPLYQEAARRHFLTRAMTGTGVRLHTATTDKSPIYPAPFRVVLPRVRHVKGKVIQQAIERDHQHLKGRYRPMRGFKRIECAQTICSGHGFIRNLGTGFYRLGVSQGDPRLPQPPRVMAAWGELTHALQTA